MSRQGVYTWSRPLRYSFEGGPAEEKGTDIRMALDAIRLARNGMLDVALFFSQDQDFSEVAAEIRVVAHQMKRWIKIASAFPYAKGCDNARGVEKTDWIAIERALYDSCLDPYDYLADPPVTILVP